MVVKKIKNITNIITLKNNVPIPAPASVDSKNPNKTDDVKFEFNATDDNTIFADIRSYTKPLKNMDINERKHMSSKLYALDNIFDISFERCIVGRGCKLSVAYIGNYNFGDISVANTEPLQKRSIGIRISDDKLVLSKVNPGGLVVEKSGNIDVKSFFSRKFSEIRGSEDKPFNITTFGQNGLNYKTKQKIELSNIFQEFVYFLLGFDIITANIVTYDLLYNIGILYSNLLIRMIRQAYILSSAYNSSDTLFSKTSLTNTLDKLDKKKSKHREFLWWK